MSTIKSILLILCLSSCSLGINAQSSDMTIDKKTIVRFNETYYNLECHLEIPEDKKLQEYLSELLFCKEKSDLKTAFDAFLKKWERANTVQTTRGTIRINFSKEYELTGRFACYHVSANIPGNAKYIQLLLSSKDDRLGEQYTKFLKGIDGEFIFDIQKQEIVGIDQIFVPTIAEKLRGAFGQNPSLYAEDRCLCVFSKKNEGRFLFNETTEKHFTDYFKQLVGWGQQKDMDTPRFLRGEAALKKFYADNNIAVASDNDLEADTISVSVVVSEDGSPTRTEIKKTTKYLPSNKLHEINEKMPKWLPAYQDGKAIAKEVTFSLGIHPNGTFADIDKPSYPGGMSALMQFLSSNIKYPVEAVEKGIAGRVECKFVVESDGSITNIQISKSVDPLLDNEAIRVVSSMPKWNPAKKNGMPVRTKYTLPVPFHLFNNITIAYEGINYRLSKKEATVISSKNKYTGSISIPETITHQGITFNVTSIGDWAFYGYSGLTSITIPSSVTKIGYDAFSDCSGLTSISVESGNTKYDSRDNCNGIIMTASNTLIVGCKNTVIPHSVTSIGSSAFDGCSSLTSVTIPNSVTSIGSNAFDGCSELTSISVESGNTKYDSRNNCNAIIETETNTLVMGCKNTVIPSSVKSIGSYAFRGCSGLTSMKIPNSVTSIRNEAFNGCSDLTSMTIPNSVDSIGDWAFNECSGLSSISIPNSVTSIGRWSFAGCSGLKSVTIGSGVTSIESGAFAGCSGLTSVTIPKSVTSIGFASFWGSGLTSVTIPKSVTSIGDRAFWDCSSLNSISVENGNPKYSSRNNSKAIIETATKTVIASYNKTEEDTIIYKANLQPSVIFNMGRTRIERSQEANVEMVAKYLNNNKDCKILVQGFANDWDVDAKSKKEWEAIQYMLSKRRADNVKEMLVKKYSIDADRIIAKGCGFTDKLFDEVEFNRVVIFHDITK